MLWLLLGWLPRGFLLFNVNLYNLWLCFLCQCAFFWSSSWKCCIWTHNNLLNNTSFMSGAQTLQDDALILSVRGLFKTNTTYNSLSVS